MTATTDETEQPAVAPPEAEPEGEDLPIPAEVAGVDIGMLTQKFPVKALKKKQGFTYVPGHLVIRRLNAATKFNWTFEIVSCWTQQGGERIIKDTGEIQRDPPSLICHGRLTIPGLGTRDNLGSHVLMYGSTESLKGCATDALKRCAMLFNVAIDLYGDDIEDLAEQAVAEHTERPARPARLAGNRRPEPAREDGAEPRFVVPAAPHPSKEGWLILHPHIAILAPERPLHQVLSWGQIKAIAVQNGREPERNAPHAIAAAIQAAASLKRAGK